MKCCGTCANWRQKLLANGRRSWRQKSPCVAPVLLAIGAKVTEETRSHDGGQCPRYHQKVEVAHA